MEKYFWIKNFAIYTFQQKDNEEKVRPCWTINVNFLSHWLHYFRRFMNSLLRKQEYFYKISVWTVTFLNHSFKWLISYEKNTFNQILWKHKIYVGSLVFFVIKNHKSCKRTTLMKRSWRQSSAWSIYEEKDFMSSSF